MLGVPTPERLVYDNLDLLVHPLAVSFTDQQLNQLWVRPLSTPPVSLGCACCMLVSGQHARSPHLSRISKDMSG